MSFPQELHLHLSHTWAVVSITSFLCTTMILKRVTLSYPMPHGLHVSMVARGTRITCVRMTCGPDCTDGMCVFLTEADHSRPAAATCSASKSKRRSLACNVTLPAINYDNFLLMWHNPLHAMHLTLQLNLQSLAMSTWFFSCDEASFQQLTSVATEMPGSMMLSK